MYLKGEHATQSYTEMFLLLKQLSWESFSLNRGKLLQECVKSAHFLYYCVHSISQAVSVNTNSAIPPTKAPTLQFGVINFTCWLFVTSQTSCTVMGYKAKLSLVRLKGAQTLKACVHLSSCHLRRQSYFLQHMLVLAGVVNFLQGG